MFYNQNILSRFISLILPTIPWTSLIDVAINNPIYSQPKGPFGPSDILRIAYSTDGHLFLFIPLSL